MITAKSPLYLAKLVVPEGSFEETLKATQEAIADAGNHFSNKTKIYVEPFGDFFALYIFIYAGRYEKDRYDALDIIGYHIYRSGSYWYNQTLDDLRDDLSDAVIVGG